MTGHPRFVKRTSGSPYWLGLGTRRVPLAARRPGASRLPFGGAALPVPRLINFAQTPVG